MMWSCFNWCIYWTLHPFFPHSKNKVGCKKPSHAKYYSPKYSKNRKELFGLEIDNSMIIFNIGSERISHRGKIIFSYLSHKLLLYSPINLEIIFTFITFPVLIKKLYTIILWGQMNVFTWVHALLTDRDIALWYQPDHFSLLRAFADQQDNHSLLWLFRALAFFVFST